MQRSRFFRLSLFRFIAFSPKPQTQHTIDAPLYQRLLDLAAALCSGLLLLFLIPCIWLANWWWAPGPLFYRQSRVGRQGRIFQIIKFRSMIVDAERAGIAWTAVADPRITPVGHFLRQTHLDELPQCWNILKGEMSLIGPRPERPEFVALLVQQIEGYAKRHNINPGLTGWAQVNYKYGDSVKDARIKLMYDLEYIQHQSLWLDVLIMVRTLGVILKGR